MLRSVRLVMGCIAALALASGIAPAVAGADWEPTIFALNGTGAVLSHPRVAVDDAGNVYAAWIEGGVLEVAKRPVGGLWEKPQSLEPNVHPSSNPDIGVDGAGNALVVWTESINVDTNVIRQATRAKGETQFSTHLDVVTGAPSLKDNPSLAVNPAGEAVLAVRSPTTGVGTAYVSLGTATGGFSSPAESYSEGPNSAIGPPDAAIDDAGDAVVAWHASTTAGLHRMHAVYRPRGGSFGPAPEDVSQPGSTPRFDPRVAVDSLGNAMAVWDEGGAGAVRAFERGSGLGGTWASVGDLDTQQSGAAMPVVVGADNAMAAWNSAGLLHIAFHGPGYEWSVPSHLATGSVSQIALSTREPASPVLAWITGGASPVADGGVPSAPPGGAQQLSPPGHGGNSIDVAVDSFGNAAAVWIDTNPPGENPRLATAEYDITQPRFVATSFSLNPTAADAAPYAALGADDWSQPTAIWDFGDGLGAIGGKVKHAYAKPGTYQATVGLFDGGANGANRKFTVQVAPPPKRGVSFNASEVSGKVLVSVLVGPGKHAPFRRLGPNDNIPIGSIIDATHGVARIETATNKSGSKRQFGRFSQGVFKVQQSKDSALTTAVLVGGGNFRKQCKASGFLAKKKRRPHRRLFGNVHGRFRTRGRHSTATVRGTKWLTQDTCSGTLTVVSRGSVTVFDFGTHKSRVVKKGHRYLARSRKKH